MTEHLEKVTLVFAALAAADFSPAFQRWETPNCSRRVATDEIGTDVVQVSSVAMRRESSLLAVPALKDWAKISRR